MKIEELVAGKNDLEEISVEGIIIPISALKKLMKEGYVHLKPYKENRSVRPR